MRALLFPEFFCPELGCRLLQGLVPAGGVSCRFGTRCEYIPVRSPSPSMARDGPEPARHTPSPVTLCQFRGVKILALSQCKHHFCFDFFSRVAHGSCLGGWRGLPGPCAAWMPHASLQGCIHGVSRQTPSPTQASHNEQPGHSKKINATKHHSYQATPRYPSRH